MLTTNKQLRRLYDKAKQRCVNPKNNSYKYYGKRGIKFLFSSFEEFCLAVGPRPTGYSLDRIDNNGHYCKENVRWADVKTQANNKRKYQTTKMHKDNSTGIKGVFFDSFYQKWKAYAYTGKRNLYLYTGTNFFEAVCARKRWENSINALSNL